MIGATNTEGLLQVGELALALGLSAVIGIEREVRQKSAGLRTHTLVGVGAALFMLVSKYGFSDVLSKNVVLDPSRIAAQIVTGIGFLGAGLIFVKSDAVRGLTTAASIWVTAAVGSAAGAGLPLLALAATAIYFFIALAFPIITPLLPRSSSAISMVRVRYADGRGVLRKVLQLATQEGFAVDELSTTDLESPLLPVTNGGATWEGLRGARTVEVRLSVHGQAPVSHLASVLTEIEGVHTVVAGDANAESSGTA